ncbi:hypothetical protein [Calidithermus terrae]|nr:hypothetical protein [Calidithermus terrae]
MRKRIEEEERIRLETRQRLTEGPAEKAFLTNVGLVGLVFGGCMIGVGLFTADWVWWGGALMAGIGLALMVAAKVAR